MNACSCVIEFHIAGTCPLTEVFTRVGGGGQGGRSSDEDGEKHFTAALDSVLNAKVTRLKMRDLIAVARFHPVRLGLGKCCNVRKTFEFSVVLAYHAEALDLIEHRRKHD